jgi:diguanylate cyclase (GGDEF)-like protein
MTLKTDQAGASRSLSTHETLSLWDILGLAHFRVYVVDVGSHQIIYTNSANPSQAGCDSVKCYQLIYQQDSPCLTCKIAELTDAAGQSNGSSITYERFNEADDHWCQLQEGTLTLADGRTAMYSIATDISDIKEMQNNLAEAHAELAFKNQQLESLSVTDRLTGLFNRRKFDEVLAQECERALRTELPLTLLLADIDHFKSVNDRYGHQVGDQILVEFARLLQQGVRRIDTVARWGGEEFMVLCPATAMADACALAESIRSDIGRYDFPRVGGKTCSFGVVEYRQGEEPQEFIRRVDQALYCAKNDGRNQVCAG